MHDGLLDIHSKISRQTLVKYLVKWIKSHLLITCPLQSNLNTTCNLQHLQNLKIKKVSHQTKPSKQHHVPNWNTKYYKASNLLCALYMMPQSKPCNMDVEEIFYVSSSLFQAYPLDAFKRYNKKMKAQTADKMHLVDTHNAMFDEEVISFPHSSKTTHNQPFWDTHPEFFCYKTTSKTNSTITCNQKHFIKHIQSIKNSICQHFKVMYMLKSTNNLQQILTNKTE